MAEVKQAIDRDVGHAFWKLRRLLMISVVRQLICWQGMVGKRLGCTAPIVGDVEPSRSQLICWQGMVGKRLGCTAPIVGDVEPSRNDAAVVADVVRISVGNVAVAGIPLALHQGTDNIAWPVYCMWKTQILTPIEEPSSAFPQTRRRLK